MLVAKTNSALLYLKPRANSTETQLFVRDWLITNGFSISHEQNIASEDISHFGYFDKQYSRIADYAVALSPEKINPSTQARSRFQKMFGIEWEDAIRRGIVMNGVESAGYLELHHKKMSDVWKMCVRDGKMCKIDRGIYCTYVDIVLDKDPIFCINGFYMSMRHSYVAQGSSVHMFVVEWEESVISWKIFRRHVVGPTDPSMAPPSSLRGFIYTNWQELGLYAAPDFEDNGIHASASAFEAMVEKANWLKMSVSTDPLCIEMTEENIPSMTTRKWCKNPLVQGKYVYDYMENKGLDGCAIVAKELAALTEGRSNYISSMIRY